MRSKPKSKLLLITCCLLAIALLGSGCGTTEESGNAVVTGQGTLTLFGVSPTTLDPAVAREANSLEYIVEIFSGLVCFDPELKLVGDIAERWEKSGDGKTYTFYLRSGVRFHDGREVTAHDFRYSLERACDPATGSQTAATYLGDIVGVDERLGGIADEISGVTVISNNVLEIVIDDSKEYFLSKLAHPVAYVVDRNNVVSGVGWWKNPNGTGPFEVEDWQDDEFIVLQRNELYYDELPRVQHIVYRLWGGVPMMMYEAGEIDITDVYLGDIERVLDPTNPLNKELSITPGFGLYYIGFNSAKPPFDDVKIRQAFCYAIDKDKIVELVFKNMVQKADGIIPPGMPGYNEYIRGLDFDIGKAQKLIAESSYGDISNLPPIALTSSGRGSASDMEGALVDMWRRNLGVEVEVKLWQPEAYPYVIMEEKDELFTFGWVADYPDPENFCDVLFHSGTKDNIGEYSNRLVDTWLEDARVEQATVARMLKYNLAEQAIVDDAACLPLFFDVSYTLVKPHVKNLPLTPLWVPRLKYVSLEPQ